MTLRGCRFAPPHLRRGGSGEFSGLDSEKLQVFEDSPYRFTSGFANCIGERMPGVEAATDNTNQQDSLRHGSQHIGCQQTLGERGGMGVETLCRHRLQDFISAEKLECPGSGVGSDAIDEDDGIASGDTVGQIERGRA